MARTEEIIRKDLDTADIMQQTAAVWLQALHAELMELLSAPKPTGEQQAVTAKAEFDAKIADYTKAAEEPIKP